MGKVANLPRQEVIHRDLADAHTNPRPYKTIANLLNCWQVGKLTK